MKLRDTILGHTGPGQSVYGDARIRSAWTAPCPARVPTGTGHRTTGKASKA
jgi:hypothetical protein